jgi:hypothetical protein
MSNRLWAAAAIAIWLMLAGCSHPNKAGSSTAHSEQRATDPIDHSDDPCYNAYYPVSPDTRLEYRVTFSGGMSPYDYSISFDPSEQSFVRHEEGSAGQVLDTTWKCEADGLRAEKYGDLSVYESRLRLDTIKGSGTAIPTWRKWQKGLKWDLTYDVRGQMTFGNTTQSVNVEGKVTVSNAIVSEEQVTVPAGSFYALKVTTTINQSLQMNGTLSMPLDSIFKVTSWYVKDVGMVKTSSPDTRQTTELVAY